MRLNRWFSRLTVSLVIPLASAILLSSSQPSDAQHANRQFVTPTPAQKVAAKQARNARAPGSVETNRIIVRLKPGVNPVTFSRQLGLALVRPLSAEKNLYLLQAANIQIAKMALANISRLQAVDGAYMNHQIAIQRDQFTPNDPLYYMFNPNLHVLYQWHLYNTIVANRDIRARGPWVRNITGKGIIIGIIDDGFEITHPDLAANYDAADSGDISNILSDPSPVTDDDNHGTAVAGLAAARGGNGIGMTGVAPFASWAGLRIDFTLGNDADLHDATLYHSDTLPSIIKVKNHSYGTSDSYVVNTLEDSATTSSTANGTIHVRSAGNSRSNYDQDANKRMPVNNPAAIVVTALGSDGVFSSYSNFGANVFCTAPSDTANPYTLGILTTDRLAAKGYNTGNYDPPYNGIDLFPDTNYTSMFGGTSASAAIVSGVMALGKQAQPQFDTRFAKHLIAETSYLVHPTDTSDTSDGGWITNGANYRFNQNYGFGLINADLLTYEAVRFTGVTPQTTVTIPTVTVNAQIPDSDPNGVTSTFTVNNTNPLESVQLTFNISHSSRGDLSIFLKSPSGTVSRLCSKAQQDAGTDINWTFTSNAFWGENPNGVWTVRVVDNFPLDIGTFNSYSAVLYGGRLIGVPTITTSLLVGPVNKTSTFLVSGNLFTPVSYVTFNGTALATKYLNVNTLQATLPASLVPETATANVGVTTPAPGGTSTTEPYYVGAFINISFPKPPTRDKTDIVVTLRLTNVGPNDAPNAVFGALTVQQIGGITVAYPKRNVPAGTIKPGGFVDGVFRFDGTKLTAGQQGLLRAAIGWTGGFIIPGIQFTLP